MSTFNRRNFLKTSLMGGVAVTYYNPFKAIAPVWDSENQNTRVSLTSGDNRADLAFRALQPFSKQIKHAIGNRRVVLKPNNVLIAVSYTHLTLPTNREV